MSKQPGIVVIVVWLGAVGTAAAQEPPAPPPKSAEEPKKEPPPPPPHTGVKATLKAIPRDFARIPSWDTLMVLGVGAPATYAAHFGDKTVNRHLKGGSITHDFFWLGKVLGQAETQAALAIGTYVVGRATNHRHVSHLGMDLLRAGIEDGALTLAMKKAVGRKRPTGECCAFPSGHASSTFAAATILERHLGWLAAVPTYAVASYVATSRLHENRHWFSDVVGGATLGLIVGRTVVHTHGRTNWGLMVVPVPEGAAVVVARAARSPRPPS
jgi:membrane-associated phospholipid phosphatase